MSVEFKDKILSELVENKQSYFKIFKGKRYNIGKRASFFYIQIQKKTSLGKMYLPPKIH